jgi:hypothetical protein
MRRKTFRPSNIPGLIFEYDNIEDCASPAERDDANLLRLRLYDGACIWSCTAKYKSLTLDLDLSVCGDVEQQYVVENGDKDKLVPWDEYDKARHTIKSIEDADMYTELWNEYGEDYIDTEYSAYLRMYCDSEDFTNDTLEHWDDLYSLSDVTYIIEQDENFQHEVYAYFKNEIKKRNQVVFMDKFKKAIENKYDASFCFTDWWNSLGNSERDIVDQFFKVTTGKSYDIIDAMEI